jgi:AGCS family alanine or glycine:cation symporter
MNIRQLIDTVVYVSGWLWGFPLITLLCATGIFLTIRLKGFQFTHFFYVMGQTFGSIFRRKEEGEGTLSAFQALTSALASTIGAGNIVGVPVAIIMGGPGAVFWMWVIALLGMAIKFSEIVLAVKYRKQNEIGEFVGGPVYYMTDGLKAKWLAVLFALALMLEVILSILIQANALANSVFSSLGLTHLVTGIATMFITGLVVIGGIKRLGRFTEKFVPIMSIFYLGASFTILYMNAEHLPGIIELIFRHAFTPIAPVGGFTGAGIAAIIRSGFARGLYSNEAGSGTAPTAHATAVTDHPVRQAMWGITEVFIDTIVICTCTAFVVLVTSVWQHPDVQSTAGGIITVAFIQSFGNTGGFFITVSLFMFVFSTIIVLIWYGEKQAEYLFGLGASKVYRIVCVILVPLGAVGTAQFLWQFLDLGLALVLIPNVIAILLLNKEVVNLTKEFLTTPGKYYLKDKLHVRQPEFKE